MSSVVAAPDFGSNGTAVCRPGRRPASARAGAAASSSPSVRLTRRGRLVLLVALVALAFAAMAVFGAQSAATGKAGAPVATRTVQVEEGDTLWRIASTVAAPGEVREMIHQIQELNALPDAGVVEGQELAVPVS